MKYLALALLLCTQLHLLNGACFRFMPKMAEDLSGCIDPNDGKVHPLDSTWRNDACQDCDCSGCCDAYSTPRRIPDDCTMEFDKTLCEYKVFKKNDPTVECPILSAVGK